MDLQGQKIQSGFALLVFLLILMGLGGIALTGITQSAQKSVESSKYEHNKQVLSEAKQALLMYAYNYPAISGNGPGRLPCADTDNDGSANTTFGACIALGRLPWNDPNLNLYDLRDADQQRLWYAVSDNFATNVAGGNVVNSDSSGSITIRDQSGAVVFDGSSAVARSGVAAIIIAPGAITTRNGVAQDRSIANADDPFDTTIDTDPGIINSINYLDLLTGTEDNANFAHDSATNGFVLGPVNSHIVDTINDQIIIITAEEVITMAEKATLAAYRDALADYQSPAKLNDPDVYPWLNDYIQIEEAADISDYDMDLGVRISQNAGRIPSMFGPYFAFQDTEPVFSEVDLIYDLNVTIDEPGGSYLDEFDGAYSPNNNLLGRSEINFSETGTSQLIGSIGTTDSGSVTMLVRYFWDEIAVPDGWELCPDNTGDERDCNQSAPGVFVGDPFSDLNSVPNRVRRVTLKIDFDSNFVFEFDYTAPFPNIIYSPPTPANHPIAAKHAGINAIFQPGKVTTTSGFVHYGYEQDDFYNNSFDPTGPDGSSGIIAATATAASFDQFDLTIDYFPELPSWAGRNADNWNDAIMLAYADHYAPGEPAPPCIAGFDCLDSIIIRRAPPDNNNVAALLIHAQDIPADNADLENIFQGENNAPDEQRNTVVNNIFNAHPNPGDDIILIVQDI